jgi:hypothetical protein
MSYPQTYVLGSYGQGIQCEIAERSVTTGVIAAVDISTATNMQIVFIAPNRERIAKTATFVNSGTDGLMQYVVEQNFFNPNNPAYVGVWQYQPQFDLGTNVDTGSYEVGQFRVVPLL